MGIEQEVSFRQLVTSASRADLLNLLDPASVQLLRTLQPSSLSDEKLVPLVLSGGGPREYLLDAQRRVRVFNLLSHTQARLLSAHLGLESSGDPHEQLQISSQSLTSQQISDVLTFFGAEEETAPSSASFSNATKEVRAGYPLFSHQRQALRRVQEQLYQSSSRRVVLHMPTGSGKTRTAMNIVGEHLRRNEPTVVVWLASSEELLEQAASEFEAAWKYIGNREVSLLRFWGGRNPNCLEVEDGLIVAGLAKMNAANQSNENFLPILGDATTLVVFDEAHQSIADTYALILDILATKRRDSSALGLTATPGRTYSDIDEDSRLSAFWSGKKIMLEIEGYDNPVKYLIEAGYLAKPTFRTINVSPGIVMSNADIRRMETSLDLPTNTLDLLSEDEKWNAAIIKETQSLVSAGHRRVIVFATTVRQALILASVMRALGYNARAVTGATPKNERESILAQYTNNSEQPMILFNFGVLTTGFDAPSTSAAVIARPTKSLVLFSQMVGRAMRGKLAGGNEHAEIVSVVDPSLPGFGDPAEAFTNWEDVW